MLAQGLPLQSHSPNIEGGCSGLRFVRPIFDNECGRSGLSRLKRNYVSDRQVHAQRMNRAPPHIEEMQAIAISPAQASEHGVGVKLEGRIHGIAGRIVLQRQVCPRGGSGADEFGLVGQPGQFAVKRVGAQIGAAPHDDQTLLFKN